MGGSSGDCGASERARRWSSYHPRVVTFISGKFGRRERSDQQPIRPHFGLLVPDFITASFVFNNLAGSAFHGPDDFPLFSIT
jgi:hypothetical protein